MSREHAFIAALRAVATTPGARGLADDAALLEVGGETLVLTHDMLIAGVHFLNEQDPADVAWKLVATNVSDLAAKGAEPVGALLGYQLGADDARFLEGLNEALTHYRMPLLGGDTVGGAGPQAMGLTAIGRATHRPVPARSGAQAGDEVWMTGAVGAAMLGLEALRTGSGDSSAYRRPQARLAEGLALAPLVSAMMDISDGLLLDAMRMGEASGTTLSLSSAAIPIAAPESRRAEALRWGDDYELLFTVPAGTAIPVPATCIGTVLPFTSAALLLDGQPLATTDTAGYQHN